MSKSISWVKRLLRSNFNRQTLAESTSGAAMAQPPQTPQTPPIPEILSEDQWRELKQKGEVTPYQSNFGTVLVLLLGSKGIGKKSLRMKLLYGDMDGGVRYREALYDPTGFEEIQRYFCGGYDFDLDIVDKLVQFHYSLLTYASFGVILAYDTQSRSSWENVARIHDALCARNYRTLPFPTVVLGLRADLQGQDCVSRQEAERFSKEHGCHFLECSAKTGDGVHETFKFFIEQAYTSVLRPDGTLDLDNRKFREEISNGVRQAFQGLEQLSEQLQPDTS